MEAASWIALGTLLIAAGGTYYSIVSSEESLNEQKRQRRLAEASYRSQEALVQKQLVEIKQQQAEFDRLTVEQKANYQETMKQVGSILSGETDVASSPMFSPQFANLQKGYETEKNRLLETLPAGGRRERAIKSLEQQYMDMRASFAGAVQKQVFNWAQNMRLPTGRPSLTQVGGATYSPTGVSGFGGIDISGLTQLGMELSRREPVEEDDITGEKPPKPDTTVRDV